MIILVSRQDTSTAGDIRSVSHDSNLRIVDIDGVIPTLRNILKITGRAWPLPVFPPLVLLPHLVSYRHNRI